MRSAVSDASELIAVIDSVVSALRRHQVPYFVTGSLASSVRGAFRATNDLDIVATLQDRQVPVLMADLSGEFIADVDQAINAFAEGSSFNLIHRVTYLKVDVFPCLTAFDREATRRATNVELPGGREPLRVASTEDILLAKARWYRLGGETSEVQRRDIDSLVALNRADLDRAYLARWAGDLGVEDLVERFLYSPGR